MNERQMDAVLRKNYPFTDSSKADNDAKLKIKSLGQANALNSYRSVTYNFTLAALKKNYLDDPTAYRTSELDLIILKSGGKGNATLTTSGGANTDGIYKQARSDFAASDPRRSDLTPEQKNVPLRDYGGELINGFNTESPGRFDMFIENVEVDTLMSFTESSGATLPTQIKFEVIEPYSVNGFIEALHVSAIAAGYPTYLEASFVLKMEFWGYPDNDLTSFKDPEKIEKTERFFPIGLTGIEVDISEKGTRYRCTAVPYNERAFGEPNVIKKPIKMSGLTIKEILTDLIKNVNEQVKTSNKEGKVVSLGNKHNTYAIKFPSRDDTVGWKDTPENNIASSKLVEILKDNVLYKMADPATTEKATAYKKDGKAQPSANQQAKEPEAIKYTPGKTVVQFSENMNIHDAITSVIRDSEYCRNILKDVKKNIDEFGMIDYFMVRIETKNLNEMDETTKKPFQNFTFIVSPYKLHYTRIPTYGQEQIDDTRLTKLCNREYNYMYTGNNIDITSFKLNFNHLYFEAVPSSFGNQDTPSAKTGAGPNNGAAPKQSATPTEVVEKQQVPTSPTKVEPTPVQSNISNAGQPPNDAYSVLARKMHDAIVDSKASMITGDMEILGDPFYIATGGVGNFNPKPDGRGKTITGEVDHLTGEVLIRINFRNPIDINSATGMMDFSPKLVPFSGVYRIIKATSTFKNGEFKQRLEILRLPGQILDLNAQESDPADRVITVPNSLNRVSPDTTRAFNPSQRLDSSTALEQLNRGLPSPGLPGALSNFTAATGGLGGQAGALLMQNPGRVLKTGALAAGSSVIGQALPTDISSNIRLNSSGLANINQTGLGSAALIAVATNVLTGNIPAKRAVTTVAGTIAGAALVNALKKPNVGSGIGEGATNVLSKAVTDSPTAQDIKFGTTINPSKIASDTVNSVVGATKELGTAAIGAVNSLGKEVSGFVKGVGEKISSFNSSPADPKAIGAQVGLDVSKLSGLSPDFQSKALNQIASFSKNLPPDVNLNQAASAGVVLDYLSPSKIKNIPPTAPYSTAPAAPVDVAYLTQVAAKGGATAVANLYGVTSIKDLSGNLVPSDVLSSTLKSLPPGQVNPFANLSGQFNAIDANVLKDKFGTAGSQLSQLTGKVPVLDKNIAGAVSSKYGSSAGPSPLDKLVNNLGDPNAPPYTGNDPIVRARLGLPPATV
jgi:hypothetical protein